MSDRAPGISRHIPDWVPGKGYGEFAQPLGPEELIFIELGDSVSVKVAIILLRTLSMGFEHDAKRRLDLYYQDQEDYQINFAATSLRMVDLANERNPFSLRVAARMAERYPHAWPFTAQLLVQLMKELEGKQRSATVLPSNNPERQARMILRTLHDSLRDASKHESSIAYVDYYYIAATLPQARDLVRILIG